MFKKNSIVSGLLVGIILPIVAFALMYGLFEWIESMGAGKENTLFSKDFRLRTLGIVSIGLNAFPMNIAFKKKQTQTMRGIVIPTFIFVVAWLLYFGKSVL
ncbi:MAG: hypothetical protein KDC24_04570 [Saprospiraceae bacterium]|nr:hypothetical protein [Saprospiraceae bacterium]